MTQVNQALTIESIREQVVGLAEKVPLRDGTMRQYVNFDNAASTPTLKPVQEKVNEFLKWYANVHRGTGFKSRLSSWIFEEARRVVGKFVNAHLKDNIVLFSKNTTEGINKLAHRLKLPSDAVVLTSLMEHHSNELPWRKAGNVVHIELTQDGRIDDEDFKSKLEAYRHNITLVALTGASNVTGFLNPIHEYAAMTHSYGAQILIDGAQLVPHRNLDMKKNSDPEHIDYLVFSAHKMYAPYGIGVLVGPRRTFEEGDPYEVGGGTVDIVTLENVYWTDLPDKEEAGTPDIVGVVALAKVIRLFQEIGWDEIIRHESELTSYALNELSKIPDIQIYGETDPKEVENRIGVISFNLKGVHHALVATILNCEAGIGVRHGCFCAHPYVKCILNVTPEESKYFEERILAHDRSELPGTVRISFGIYNTKHEIDLLCEALWKIAQGDYRKDYVMNKEKGEYTLPGFEPDFRSYFEI